MFFGFLPISADAATLSFSPASGSYTVGQTLSVSVYVGSADQTMNAASGVISFPPDKLEVTSLSKTGSIFTLWVQEPSFSNSVGTINFEGVVLNPGFKGAKGKVLAINFKIKAAGVASLSFSSGSVLANDGKGTNILSSLGKAQFSLGGAAPSVSKTTIPSAVSGIPPAPAISSPTHPDPNKWYNNSSPKFIWTLSKDIIATRILYDKNPGTKPTVLYNPPISEKEISKVKDGMYYFHVQLRNKNGWGNISHFQFQIDTESPEPFAIKFIDGIETKNPRPTVVFDTTDSLSGVNYYKIKIGEGEFFPVAPEVVKSNPYTLPLQNPGKRSILVQAYDNAGNYAVATEEFTILPAPEVAEKTETKITKFPVIIIFIIAFLFLLLVFWYGWYKFLRLRRTVKKGVREAESALHKSSDLLKEDIREQIKMLEKTRTKRQLTKEEERIVKRLRKDLDEAEKFIRKEIEDIEKEVK